MKSTVWILEDQLTPRISALAGVPKTDCVILMIESFAWARRLPYHKQKITLVWAAMRHFADELRRLGYTVDYYPAQPDYQPALKTHIHTHEPRHIRLMESADWGVTRKLGELVQAHERRAEVTPNNMFLSDRAEFVRDSRGKKTLLMETFYRKMRRKTGLLMDGKNPEGGQWNYDTLNRERPETDHVFPQIPRFKPDGTTRAVMELVGREFSWHFGELDEFCMPVTRTDAERLRDDFLEHRLDLFGPYQDAIIVGQPTLYHSLLSPLLNIGLLEPLDLCRRAQALYQKGRVRINSAEGFIRQIIGWREFIYQVYHLKMPGYTRVNFLKADLPLPDLYWTGDTKMFCVADAIRSLRHNGINHHIQRLMVTGNFALIAGIDPQAVNEWYWFAYADAYEWVVTPNVLGLSLYADGGLVATKPYAASANYINKMSNCCSHCAYDHRQSVGEKACPFNALYWDFLARNAKRLQKNPRMNMVMSMLRRRDRKEMKTIRTKATEIRKKLQQGKPL